MDQVEAKNEVSENQTRIMGCRSPQLEDDVTKIYDADDEAFIKWNAQAMRYFTLALTDKAFPYVRNCSNNAQVL